LTSSLVSDVDAAKGASTVGCSVVVVLGTGSCFSSVLEELFVLGDGCGDSCGT